MTPLLARWRECPARELADALDRDLAAVAANAAPADQGDWETRVKKVTPEDRPELAALLSSLHTRKLADVAARVRGLRRLGADPRVAAAVASLVREIPFTSNSSLGMFDFVARKARGMFQLKERSRHVCNDRIVAVAGDDGLTLVDLDAGAMRRLIETPAHTVAISPDGQKLAARIDQALVVLDLGGHELLRIPCSD